MQNRIVARQYNVDKLSECTDALCNGRLNVIGVSHRAAQSKDDLIYYAIVHVRNVYLYFQTATSNGKPTREQ